MKRLAWMMLVLAFTVAGTAQESRASNWDVFTRWLETSPPSYGHHKTRGCQDCLTSWQPIQSAMHYNVLPPGMYRPVPMRRPNPSLSPRTPSFQGADTQNWRGCRNGCSTDR